MLIDFCLPTYNEEKILKNNVLKLLNYCRAQNFNFHWRIIVVVNGSPDDSFALAKKLSYAHPKEIIAFNIISPGRGNALKKIWLESAADILVYMDIDLSASLKNIADLLKPLIENKTDLTIGSRMMAGAKIKRSFFRELNSRGYIFISKIILGHKFSDLQCGFKAVKRETFIKIAPYLKDDKWFFDTELIILANLFYYKIKEIPIEWEERRHNQGKSKVKIIRDALKFIADLVKLKFRLRKITPLS
jgi:glycosyltransferase involved in cell wall biosynthesis